FIKKELEDIGFNAIKTAKTGLIATISTSKEGNTIALRADIDALNIQEQNDVPYCSKNKGKMHACGHDAHTAMLLAAAKIIKENMDYLKGTIKLVFQPAEEGWAGAKHILDEGHLNDVDYIFGLHVWQDLPSGVIAVRRGPTFASSDRFKVIIKGKGGHVANPHQTIDPTSVLNDIYSAMQKVISREINPFEHVVLALPVISGSKAHNIIPDKVQLQGTLRTLNPIVKEYIIKRLTNIVEGYSKAWRCEGKIEFDEMAYPAVINDNTAVDKATKILAKFERVHTMKPTMIGEDFAFYLQKIKGALFTLGISNQEKGIIYPHHHPKFQVDEDILWKGTALYAILSLLSTFPD
ncbi:MAG: M20 metallopeptidase family protein, partial [Candidatus Hodarchaeales archaeon]